MKKTKLFILDSNTFVSAFLLSATSKPARAYYKAKSEGKLIMSTDTFNELADVFIRPKFDRYHPLPNRLRIIDDLRELVEFIMIKTTIKACRDPKDDKYLELAVDGNANCIITGDNDLLTLHPFKGIPILTADEFLEQF